MHFKRKFYYFIIDSNNNIIMSIYSGFATRFQEEAYDHCIDSLLYVLQKRIIKFYQGEQADQEKFIAVVLKLQHQMRNMEKNKYLQPKSSQSISELIKFMQIYQQNIAVGNQNDPTIASRNDPMKQNQPSKRTGEQSQLKDKASYWVENTSKVEQNPQQQEQQTEQQMPKKGSFKHQPLVDKQGDKQLEFKRTALYNNVIHQVKPKSTSRINLSRDRQQTYFTGQLSKPEKNRSISGMLNEKQPTIYSKVSYKHYPQEQGTSRKRKIKSINKSVNQMELQNIGVRNEVSDIIKDYIIKSKRSKRVLSRNPKHQLDYLGKLNDF